MVITIIVVIIVVIIVTVTNIVIVITIVAVRFRLPGWNLSSGGTEAAGTQQEITRMQFRIGADSCLCGLSTEPVSSTSTSPSEVCDSESVLFLPIQD